MFKGWHWHFIYCQLWIEKAARTFGSLASIELSPIPMAYCTWSENVCPNTVSCVECTFEFITATLCTLHLQKFRFQCHWISCLTTSRMSLPQLSQKEDSAAEHWVSLWIILCAEPTAKSRSFAAQAHREIRRYLPKCCSVCSSSSLLPPAPCCSRVSFKIMLNLYRLNYFVSWCLLPVQQQWTGYNLKSFVVHWLNTPHSYLLYLLFLLEWIHVVRHTVDVNLRKCVWLWHLHLLTPDDDRCLYLPAPSDLLFLILLTLSSKWFSFYQTMKLTTTFLNCAFTTL